MKTAPVASLPGGEQSRIVSRSTLEHHENFLSSENRSMINLEVEVIEVKRVQKGKIT